MDRSTKIMIGGVLTGALAIGLGAVNSRRLQGKIDRLQKQCIAENAGNHSYGPWNKYQQHSLKHFTEQQFAAAIRQQYPGSYDDLSDADLTRRVLGKYPDYEQKLWTGERTSDFVPDPPPGFVPIESSEVVCDPLAMTSWAKPFSGVQEQMATAQREFWRWNDEPMTFGIVIAALCAIPWTWYFLLRRIRELREAIVGK